MSLFFAELRKIWVGLVQNRVQRAAELLTVLNGNAVRLVDIHAQVAAAGLLDVFHVPNLTILRLGHRLRQRPDDICNFTHTSPNPLSDRLKNFKKKSGRRAHSVKCYIHRTLRL